MNKNFSVKREGIGSDSDEIIKIAKKSKRSKKQKHVYGLFYDDIAISKEYSDKKIPSLVDDLVNIALATFTADLATRRDVYVPAKNRNEEGRFFSRKISIKIPVTDKEKWDSLKSSLEKTVSYMTYDTIKYTFIPMKKSKVEIKKEKTSFDSVALFSGGLDSFAGSFYLSDKFKPFFVSINHGKINDLLNEAYKQSPVENNKTIVKVKKQVVKGRDFPESTQFSRSFVYLSIAVAIAISKGVKKIFVPENGVIANQIGLNEEKFGTRTVHPKYLNYFNELVNSLFGLNFEIENPFNYLTKAEVVSHIKNKEGISKTVSCAHPSRFKSTQYCGMCMPCILRIISISCNDISNERKIADNGINSFLINLDAPEVEENVTKAGKFTNDYYRDALINILDLIKFANEMQSYTKKDILSKYYQLYDENLYDMYFRFSKEIIKTLKHYSKVNSSLIGRIPKSRE